MSNILINSIEPAADYSRRVQAGLTQELPYIFASEVIAEFQKRCGNGMQYTTFPNRISDEEKSKLTAAGYIVTENTVDGANRNGAPDLYIGFQVALNSTAAQNAMVIGQVESNGIGGVGANGELYADGAAQEIKVGTVNTGSIKIKAFGTGSCQIVGKMTADDDAKVLSLVRMSDFEVLDTITDNEIYTTDAKGLYSISVSNLSGFTRVYAAVIS